MKKLLLLLLCVPLMFSCGESNEEKQMKDKLKEVKLKVDKKYFNYLEINDPCVFLDTTINIIKDMSDGWNAKDKFKKNLIKYSKEGKEGAYKALYYMKIWDKRRDAIAFAWTRWNKEDFEDCEQSDRNIKIFLSADSLFSKGNLYK